MQDKYPIQSEISKNKPSNKGALHSRHARPRSRILSNAESENTSLLICNQ